jgi:hypothetical protein
LGMSASLEGTHQVLFPDRAVMGAPQVGEEATPIWRATRSSNQRFISF